MIYPPPDSRNASIQEQIIQFSQPIEQKMFSFVDQTNDNLEFLHQQRYIHRRWKPVIPSKKMVDDPKIVFSVQRKKARIISGLRQKQINYSKDTKGKMSGSKVKKQRFWKYQAQKQESDDTNEKSTLEMRRPMTAVTDYKNPHMNFSLMYISERKKWRQMQQKNMKRKNSSNRQKGSNNGYLGALIGNTVLVKSNQVRPKSSITPSRPQTSISFSSNRRRILNSSLE